MAARSLSFICIILLFSCASSAEQRSLYIENTVKSCFELKNVKLQYDGEIALINADVKPGVNDMAECLCKSALTKYMVSQEKEAVKHHLLTGNFTVLGRSSVLLPVAAQKQLIFPDTPLLVTFSCGEP